MSPEFNLIQRYFTRPNLHTDKSLQADLGVGDDAALVSLAAQQQLAISTDMLVAGTHFFADCNPYLLGWKCLAVNVSDMAAMGAQAKWATLALALPDINPAWLAEFSRGFFACADAFGVELIGGDTTRGALTISVTIMGEVAKNQALRRDAAQLGDEIWVSGTLGDAALALAALQNRVELDAEALSQCRSALEQPQPRLALGLALRGIAHSAIDISDGLLADLGHILEQSKLAAVVQFEALPCSSMVSSHLHTELGQNCILAGGDDYELCFTASPAQHAAIQQISTSLGLQLACIGHTTEAKQQQYRAQVYHGAQALTSTTRGYDHFA